MDHWLSLELTLKFVKIVGALAALGIEDEEKQIPRYARNDKILGAALRIEGKTASRSEINSLMA